MATPLGQHPTLFPKHYCSQFHPKYNPKVADLAKAANMSDWGDAVPRQVRRHRDSRTLGQCRQADARPVDRRRSPIPGGATRVVMERNPYFWQVDPAGNQLPYIDRITFNISQDVESLMLDAISGRLDIQDRHIDTLQNKPTLSQNMQKGGYRLIELINSGCQQVQIYLNITHKDPKMREMFANKEFRQALSLRHRPQGDHRHRLSSASPSRTSPARGRGIPGTTRSCARQFTEHEPAKANAMLDKLGYNKKDARASACGPTGRRCSSPSTSSRRSTPTRRHARTGEAALGRHRRRHEGQHHRARALLHARRQQRP